MKNLKNQCLILLLLFSWSSILAQDKPVPTPAEGKAFLEQNKLRPGVSVTPSGLQYLVVKKGTGAKLTGEERVRIHYSMAFVNGQKLWSTFDSRNAWEHHLDKALPGMREALLLMPVGSRWTLFMPAETAFGADGDGDRIPPGAVLVCEIELLAVID